MYIELTTLKQPLVTKKNRKVRKLREMYPDVNIKVLYGSDYRKLIEKFAGSAAPPQEKDDGCLDVAGGPDESARPDPPHVECEDRAAEDKINE
jgi:hypothetical protein